MSDDPVMRLLLVEDSPTAVMLVRMLLDEWDDQRVELSQAESLAEAMERLGGQSFDLILLDLTLSDACGLHSVHAVYAAAPATPIVVLTASDDEELGLRALQSGAQDYLIKDDTDRRLLRRAIRYAIERKRGEEALREAKERAEAATHAKSSFIANLSHELRTPLNAIIGFTDIMQSGLMGVMENARYLEYVRDINQAGQHLLDLINDIMDLSRIEAGRLELHESVVPLPSVVDFVLSVVRDRARAARIGLDAEVSDDLPQVRADGVRLRQILLNLLTNAVKFTPPGGAVRLRAEVAGDGWLVLTVIDNGVGMTEEELRTALTAFGRIHKRSNGDVEGAGLGLPLTAKLVELHGGTFSLRPIPDGGTIATVRLPPKRLAISA